MAATLTRNTNEASLWGTREPIKIFPGGVGGTATKRLLWSAGFHPAAAACGGF